MARFLCFLGARLKRLFFAHMRLGAPTLGQMMAGLSLLGVLGLGYLFGAAVLFFQLPSADFLQESFAGARAWHERGRSTIPTLSPEAEAAARKKEGLAVDRAEKTSDGFTLYTTNDAARATLLDMRGTVIHRWELPFSRVWSPATHVRHPLPDSQIHWFHCYLYPNGDLLAVYHADGDTPYGYGLVKLDKDSKLLWAYANRCHHDVDVGEDGTIYTLTEQIVSEPPSGLEFRATPYLADSLVILSPEGRELENIPLLEAFANSPYSLNLSSDNNPRSIPIHSTKAPDWSMIQAKQPDSTDDVLHTNSVKVLKRALAAKFPLFKAGQVLLSMRNLSTIAVLDLHTHRVSWAAQGVWRIQHDAEFLDNGHLLLYDNAGTRSQTRILEFDPLTHAIPWVYANEQAPSFSASYGGMKQRLPNDNTFIVDPDNRRLFEVTRDKELVWEIVCPLSSAPPGQQPKAYAITGARRYGPDELTFLKGVARARP
jgi:hypothetical protein